MKERFKIICSSVIAFVMMFVFSLQPHASYAEQNHTQNSTDTTVLVEDSKELADEEHVTESIPKQGDDQISENPQVSLQPKGPNDQVNPSIVPLLLAPVAVAGLSWTLIDSIFVAGLGWYVGTQAQDMFKGSVNDKQSASTVQYSMPTSIMVYNSFPDYAGFTLGTSATKHMESDMVQDVATRIRNYGSGSNLRLYSSTVSNNVMAVIDISSDLGGTVNRNLGNSLSGTVMQDPNMGNEWMNLKGFSIFIISNRANGQLFHAHFTPTRLRDAEIEYNRYVGEFDVQFYPLPSHTTKYLKSDLSWGINKSAAMGRRGLEKDTTGRTSVVPKN